MEKEQIEKLIGIAAKMRKFSYAPYSSFRVGAALLAQNGKIFTGCNIENAAYTPTICAERNAFFKAVSEGVREFSAICVMGGKEAVPEGFSAPCGVCRQVMMEFCDPDTFQIIVAKSREDYRSYLLKELLPEGFGPMNLG